MELEIVAKVCLLLKRSDLQPQATTNLHLLPGWDSQHLMNLLMQLERERNIRFQASDVAKLRSWGDLISLVRKCSSDGRKDP